MIVLEHKTFQKLFDWKLLCSSKPCRLKICQIKKNSRTANYNSTQPAEETEVESANTDTLHCTSLNNLYWS